ncbi:MAG: mechanosensitive ion channel domain-containing protein [Pseudomonadota bacterium]
MPSFAQDGSTDTTTPIAVENSSTSDTDLRDRLRAIFSEIDELGSVRPSVSEGVVVLRGDAPNDNAAQRAISLAERLEGVVAVEDDIDRTLSIEDNLNPLLERYQGVLDAFVRGWPLYAVALAAFLIVATLGYALSSWTRLWDAIAPNLFIARLLSQTVLILGFLLGLLLALSILDAMALFGAAAGGAGLIGLAVGFAVRDTIENYIASVMLSLRQPFRANDFVAINDLEGIVVRLTSRATILRTLDGNHLRIPNAQVFKGIILNYTRNPQRRFDFELGIDTNNDPLEAIGKAEATLLELSFVLAHPAPLAGIQKVGDSSIVIWFAAWIDQRETDFLKARSGAINAVKRTLETAGFSFPEPIYRLRIDGAGDGAIIMQQAAAPDPEPIGRSTLKEERPAAIMNLEDLDVSPETDVQKQVEQERAEGNQEDLLNDERPIE